jgi:hypothetical protein
MKKEQIDLIVISETSHWREQFYMKLEREGHLRIRCGNAASELPIHFQVDCQKQFFLSLISMVQQEMFEKDGILRAEHPHQPERSLLFSGTVGKERIIRSFHFFGDSENYMGSGQYPTVRTVEKIIAQARSHADRLTDDIRSWIHSGTRPPSLPESALVCRSQRLFPDFQAEAKGCIRLFRRSSRF